MEIISFSAQSPEAAFGTFKLPQEIIYVNGPIDMCLGTFKVGLHWATRSKVKLPLNSPSFEDEHFEHLQGGECFFACLMLEFEAEFYLNWTYEQYIDEDYPPEESQKGTLKRWLNWCMLYTCLTMVYDVWMLVVYIYTH